MDLNNIEIRQPYSSKQVYAKGKKKTAEDWNRIYAAKARKEKERIESLTSRVAVIDGKKVRILKPTKDQPYGGFKKREKAGKYFAKLKKINGSR
jgi:hypothetical protein